MMKTKLLFAFIIINLAVPKSAYTQINEAKLTANDVEAGDLFGEGISISGDYAIVGAWNDNDSGSAYIFVRDGQSWTEQAKLTASDATEDSFFGKSVSISGDYAIVGARYADDDVEGSSGSAYIFNRNGQNWTEQAKLTASDAASISWFGVEVSINGDYAIVGAQFPGSAYIFVRDGQSWTEQAKLTASDTSAGGNFGGSVSISSDYAIVGAPEDDHAGRLSGAAYVFVFDGQSWTEQAKLTASDAAEQDRFGSSVSISGDYAIVGAWGENFISGSAYVFIRNGQSWTEQTKLTASDATSLGTFGISVSISGDNTIVGAFQSNAAYLFVRDGESWIEQAKLTASDGVGGDEFGLDVSISGDNTIVGARSGNAAYVYSGITVSLDRERVELPTDFVLSQNYPNPFNPETVIEYTLPQFGEVSLGIYNLIGVEVVKLVDGNIPAGNHQVIWDASNFASGIYFYRLQAGDFVQTRKMVLLK